MKKLNYVSIFEKIMEIIASLCIGFIIMAGTIFILVIFFGLGTIAGTAPEYIPDYIIISLAIISFSLGSLWGYYDIQTNPYWEAPEGNKQ